MASLKQRAVNARAAADKAEAARIAANATARELAQIAAELEAKIDADERAKTYEKHGDPVLAPLNRELSSDPEIAAAREAGAF